MTSARKSENWQTRTDTGWRAVEKSAALTFYRREKFIHHYEKGGMTDVRFCGTAFCIIDFMGDSEAPDRETERRTQEEQKVTHSKWSELPQN